jgi:hypothetical protein
MSFLMGMVMLAVMSLLAPFLQGLMHYSVLQSGYLMSSRSIGTMVSMLVVGRMVGRIDARLLIATGLGLTAYSLWQMTQYNLTDGHVADNAAGSDHGVRTRQCHGAVDDACLCYAGACRVQ